MGFQAAWRRRPQGRAPASRPAPRPSLRRSGAASASPARLALDQASARVGARREARASTSHRGEAGRTLETWPAPARHSGAPCRPWRAGACGGWRSRDCRRSQADQLAIEQHAVASECRRDGGQLWELFAAVPAGPRAQAHPVPVASQLKTHPVELHLDCPAVPDGHRTGTRQHRGDETRKLLARHDARVGEAGRTTRIRRRLVEPSA
jgi:hypothetical protein